METRDFTPLPDLIREYTFIKIIKVQIKNLITFHIISTEIGISIKNTCDMILYISKIGKNGIIFFRE